MSALQVLNNAFPNIFVLSIQRLTQRHALVANNLKGLQYQLFFGADKQEITLAQFEATGLYNNNAYIAINKDAPAMGLGAFCCAYGHYKIYEHMVSNNIAQALILEDDIALIPENLTHLNSILKQLPNNWELLYLGYNRNEQNGWLQKLKAFWYSIKPPHTRLNIAKEQFKKYYPQPCSENIWRSGYHDCTHAYAITLEAAKKLLAMQTPIAYKSDTLLSFAITKNVINGFIAKPKIFNQFSINKNSGVLSEVEL